MTLTEFIEARLAEKEAHAKKDLWCADRASADWEGHPGYNLPYSELWGAGQVIARFTATRGAPLADGEDDQHQADQFLAARMGSAARPRAERALREVEAMRKILALHQARGIDRWQACTHCRPVDPEYPDDLTSELWPCRTLRALAAIWSDLPDFAEASVNAKSPGP